MDRRSCRVTIGRADLFAADIARKMALSLLSEMAEGRNPKAEKKQAVTSRVTLADAFDAFFAARPHLSPHTVLNYSRSIRIYLKAWRKKPVNEITRQMVLKRHQELSAEIGKTTANNVMRHLRSVYNFTAATHDDFPPNPVTILTQARAWHREQRRQTLVTAQDLPQWWKAVMAEPDYARDFLLMALFTGMRRGELMALRWENVDLTAWTLHLPRTKNGDALHLPLSSFLVDQLTEREKRAGESPFVFPGPGRDGYLKETTKFLLRVSAGPGAEGAAILVRSGFLPQAVDAAETALLAVAVPIYQRYDSLVRPVRLTVSAQEDGVGRDSGALILQPVVAAWLREQFALTSKWLKEKDDTIRRVDPPAQAPVAYLARVGDWRVPFFQGVIQSPTLRADGTVLQEPGYDAATALLYDPGSVVFPAVFEAPTKADAEKAIAILAEPFRDFCFASKADRSVTLVAVLTALVKPMFPAAPLCAIEAPRAGTRKSLLAETIGVIATGHKPAILSQGDNGEEDQKRLSSVLMAGDQVIIIDNCDRSIQGDFLCSMLTQERVRPRTLGKSEMRTLPTRCLVMATGNNLTLWRRHACKGDGPETNTTLCPPPCRTRRSAELVGSSGAERQQAPNRLSSRFKLGIQRGGWCRMGDSNTRPTHYECVALPAELMRLTLWRPAGCLAGGGGN